MSWSKQTSLLAIFQFNKLPSERPKWRAEISIFFLLSLTCFLYKPLNSIDLVTKTNLFFSKRLKMSPNLMHSICLIIFLAGMQTTQAVDYTVTNNALGTAGGIHFNNAIGTNYAIQTLNSATQFIWTIFQQQNNPSDRKNVQKVSLIVEDIDGVAYTSNNEIHLSARYVGNYSGDVRIEVTGVLYHEMTHVWQWNGNGKANGGLIEGIADFVRLKAGYAPSHWVKPGQGDRWDQGYDVTAYFLDYCESLRSGFVAALNKMMTNDYSDQFFVDLLGKSVDQLWTEYKAKYGN